MKSNSTPLDKIKDLYSSSLKEKGVDSASVGWNSPESQALRFEKLTSIIVERDNAVSVNDYGCGYGAHAEYLEKVSGIRIAEYNGYDLSDKMLSAARSHLSWFEGKQNLINSSVVTTQADYSFVSGTFNVRFDADEKTWCAFIEEKLHEIHNFSRHGFAFNLLSTYVDWKEPHLYYGDPCYWFDFCKCKFSKKVSLLHDYPLYEWTILVKK